MHKIFEEIEDIIIELVPMLAFITIFSILIFAGGIAQWLNNIATWMFG